MSSRHPSTICASCRALTRPQSQYRSQFSSAQHVRRSFQTSSAREQCFTIQRTWRPQLSKRQGQTQCRPATTKATATSFTSQPAVPSTHLPVMQGMVNELSEAVLREPSATNKIPEEHEVVKVLKTYQDFAKQLLSEKVTAPKTDQSGVESTATSALLDSFNKKQAASNISKEDILKSLASRSDAIIQAPTVFITQEIIQRYIALQVLLGRPQQFPQVLRLYRQKPVPRSTTSAPYVTYSEQNADSPSTAVLPETADAALQGAIDLHDLPLALSVIDETYCTKSYMRSKFLRSALIPVAGAVFTPLAAYSLASRFALIQNTMDNSYATGVAMAGILTYASAVGTIGYVALTTANDQMMRVTWAQGVPLWERWMREEERAALDRVAQAWGFKVMDKWGEEEGFDWNELKERIGLRGMVLDKVELMEGME